MTERRVLVVLHEGELGGASRAVLRCVPGLEERGWSFTFWVPKPSAVFDHLAAAGADVHGRERPVAYSLAALRLPPGPARRLASTPAYLSRLLPLRSGALRPALVHANSHVTLAELCIARRAAGPVDLPRARDLRRGPQVGRRPAARLLGRRRGRRRLRRVRRRARDRRPPRPGGPQRGPAPRPAGRAEAARARSPSAASA